MVECASQLAPDSWWVAAGERFVDIGSGCGRLAIAAAMVYEWSCVHGLELLSDLHCVAVESSAKLLRAAEDDETPIALCPLVFSHGEAETLLPELFAPDEATPVVAFAYCTTWPSSGPFLTSLSATLGRTLPLGSRVVIVDKRLLDDDDQGEWAFRELREPIEAPNYATVSSVAHVYERVSCGQAGEPRQVSL